MNTMDLMIGDWVILKSNGVFPDSVHKVTDISIDGVFVEDCDNLIASEELEPIPLTKEILIKNGFDEDKRSKYFHVYALDINGKWDLVIGWSQALGFIYEDISLTSVHVLQHLLRLLNVEKPIIL